MKRVGFTWCTKGILVAISKHMFHSINGTEHLHIHTLCIVSKTKYCTELSMTKQFSHTQAQQKITTIERFKCKNKNKNCRHRTNVLFWSSSVKRCTYYRNLWFFSSCVSPFFIFCSIQLSSIINLQMTNRSRI